MQNAGGIVTPAADDTTLSTSGCTAADFAGFAAGKVALVQRGGCTFAEKAINAQTAGASAVIIFNEGNAGRTDNFGGTLGGTGLHHPGALGLLCGRLCPWRRRQARRCISSPAPGPTSSPPGTSSLKPPAAVLTAWSRWVPILTAFPTVPASRTMAAAAAAILEIALQMKALGINPRNKVRFMWFGAEEAGLLGSEHYVESAHQAPEAGHRR